MNDWAEGVKALGRISTRFPQTAYAGLVKALQNEWTYLQRVTTGSGSLYAPIEKAITENFLPALLGQATIDHSGSQTGGPGDTRPNNNNDSEPLSLKGLQRTPGGKSVNW